MFSDWTLSDKIAAITSVATALQFIALVITVGVMIRNGRRQLRAYVNVVKITGRNLGDKHTFTIDIKNFGQTPAYREITRSTAVFADFPLVQELIVSDDLPGKTGPGVLAPGAEHHVVMELKPPLSNDELDQVRRGSKAIYVFGKIQYVDAFRGRRQTLFRFMIGGDAVISASGNCALAPDGNEAT
jgi:hypothetical protein